MRCRARPDLRPGSRAIVVRVAARVLRRHGGRSLAGACRRADARSCRPIHLTMDHVMKRSLPLLILPILVLGALAGVAAAKTSHAGWPTIDGVLRMHKQDQSGHIHGTTRNDELLGGHGNDTAW